MRGSARHPADRPGYAAPRSTREAPSSAQATRNRTARTPHESAAPAPCGTCAEPSRRHAAAAHP